MASSDSFIDPKKDGKDPIRISVKPTSRGTSDSNNLVKLLLLDGPLGVVRRVLPYSNKVSALVCSEQCEDV